MDKYADEIFETIKFIPTPEEFENIKKILEQINDKAFQQGYDEGININILEQNDAWQDD